MSKEPEWIEHDGSAECPVPHHHRVEVKYRSGSTRKAVGAEWINWRNVPRLTSADITHYRDWTAFEQQQASKDDVPKRLWLWRNHIDGKPEYWAFDNAYPCHENDDPITLGHPIGWAIFKRSVNGRPDVSDDLVKERFAATEQASKDAPRLLTEAKLRAILDTAGAAADWRNDNIVKAFREEGLILPEPVDPLLVEAREMAADVYEIIILAQERAGLFASDVCPFSDVQKLPYIQGKCDEKPLVQRCLAALRRGMELARGVTLDCVGEGA